MKKTYSYVMNVLKLCRCSSNGDVQTMKVFKYWMCISNRGVHIIELFL